MQDRRQFLVSALCLGLPLMTVSSTSQAEGTASPYSDPELVEKWMGKWMEVNKSATGTLHLGRFADPMYFLLKQIDWSPDPGKPPYPSVSVPPGFVTDFASVPRIFWTLLPPDGLYTYPAIVHDYLYWFQPVSRQDADAIFLEIMEEFEVRPSARAAIHAGVRAGGGIAWDANAKLRDGGEKRILRRMPDRPQIRWNDWRRDPNNF